MNDDPIGSLLRSLPRENASHGFTDRVMSRLLEKRQPLFLQTRFAVAGLVVALTASLGVWRWYAAEQEEAPRQRIQALRTEVERLQRDIQLLRELAPVLYVGGDEDVDFVIDLRKLVREDREGDVRPTSLGTSETTLEKRQENRR